MIETGYVSPPCVIAAGMAAGTSAIWKPATLTAICFRSCNHNLLLADAIHRGSGHRPILPDVGALIIDEAHKLPEDWPGRCLALSWQPRTSAR